MKKFKVSGSNGPIEADQLGTFAAYIQGEQFRFVVTRITALDRPALTHRASGKRVCDISPLQQSAAVGDIVGAAKLALNSLIERVGAARVRSVLAASE